MLAISEDSGSFCMDFADSDDEQAPGNWLFGPF